MQEYNHIDQCVHQLTQTIAKANRTFVPKQPDDSHTNLFFDPISHRIYGRWIKSKNSSIILSLNLRSNRLEWLDKTIGVLDSVSIVDQDFDQLEGLVEVSMDKLGLDNEGFRQPLHFQITTYGFLEKPMEAFHPDHLKEWEFYRGYANDVSYSLLGYLQEDSEVRIWPHHFDTGIYVEIAHQIGLGFGLAMEDNMVGKPYFYFSGSELEGHSVDFQNVPKLSFGNWILHDYWKGAVLPLPLLKQNNPKIAYVFIKEVAQWFLKNL